MSSERIRLIIRAYFLVGSILLLLLAVLYIRSLSEEAREESNFSAHSISGMVALALQAEEDELFYDRLRSLLDEVAEEAPFPLIITDVKGRPLFWEGVPGIPVEENPDFELLRGMDLNNPPNEEMATLIALAREFRHEGQALVYYSPVGKRRVQGYVCYGESSLAERLRRGIVVQLLIFLLFLITGTLGFFLVKRFEQESVWVGLAKETAHQMGTPLTSLLGWIHLGQARVSEMESAGGVEETFREMGHDVERLQKVSDRFNSIGGSPNLKRDEMRPIVEKTVEYFRTRLPHYRTQVEIEETYDEVPLVSLNAELLEWVVENLIKNALDAIDKEEGRIQISLSYQGSSKSVDLHVRDNGRGITSASRRKVFRPGFTSRSGGWGLGLTLSRRIVEEYHGGELFLLDSHEGHGSCFVMRLPA